MQHKNFFNYHQDDDKMAALHAKVISVDQQQTLITSANLSYHGQQGNIELGTLIESKQIAKQILPQLNDIPALKEATEIVIGAEDVHKNLETLASVWQALSEQGSYTPFITD